MKRLATALTVILAAVVPFLISTSSPAHAIDQKPGKWRCGAWSHKGSAGGNTRWCVQLTKITGTTSIDYTRLLHNKFNHPAMMSCSTSKTTTFHYGGDVTVKEELGAIFAKMEASISVDIYHETSTTDSASANLKVKAHGWANCKRGEVIFKVQGYARKQSCMSGRCGYSDEQSISAHAPATDFFAIGPGKNISTRSYIPKA